MNLKKQKHYKFCGRMNRRYKNKVRIEYRNIISTYCKGVSKIK